MIDHVFINTIIFWFSIWSIILRLVLLNLFHNIPHSSNIIACLNFITCFIVNLLFLFAWFVNDFVFQCVIALNLFFSIWGIKLSCNWHLNKLVIIHEEAGFFLILCLNGVYNEFIIFQLKQIWLCLGNKLICSSYSD
jgi:hypothetical protein